MTPNPRRADGPSNLGTAIAYTIVFAVLAFLSISTFGPSAVTQGSAVVERN